MKLNERELPIAQDALEHYINYMSEILRNDNLSKGHHQTLEFQQFNVQYLLSKIQAYNECFEHQGIPKGINLQLSLKEKWFKLTESGVKTEDYRDINDYWFTKLVFECKEVFKYTSGHDWDSLDKESLNAYLLNIAYDDFTRRMIAFKPFITNTITLSYPKSADTERILKFEHKSIEIGWGKPDLGGDPNKLYFIIKHGRPLS